MAAILVGSDPIQNPDHLQTNLFLTIPNPDKVGFQIPTVFHYNRPCHDHPLMLKSFLLLQYLGCLEVFESRGLDVCEKAFKILKVIFKVEGLNGWVAFCNLFLYKMLVRE